MEITRIKIDYKDEKYVKGNYSVTFNNCISVNLGYIIDDKEKNEKFAAFPYIEVGDMWLDLAHPITQEFKDEINKKILELYDNHVDEYIKIDDTAECKITEFNCKILNPDEGICEAEIVVDNVFKIHKISMKKENDNSYSYYYPFSQMINDKRIYAVEFERKSIIKQLIQHFAKWCSANFTKVAYASNDIKAPEERREKSNKKIKSMGIVCYENLRTRENGADVKLKSVDDICKRAVASFCAIQVACDINNGNYQESVEYFSGLLEKFGVKSCLNEKEKRLFDGSYSKQDVIDIDWEYETYWAIVWALGLIEDDISNASGTCDCNKAISLVSNAKGYEDFKSKCHMRSIEEILDMLDLYFRYHWATIEKRINPDTPIGNLNSSVVVERRRGLEWLISDKDDWYEISLDT